MQNKGIHTFSKAEKLCGEIRINQLFTEGKAFIAYPFRIVYAKNEEEDAAPVRVLISVPKKRFKSAVDRNRLKRLIREAYRLNKQEFVQFFTDNNIKLNIAFTFVGNDMTDFLTLEHKMKSVLTKLKDPFQNSK